MRGKKSLPHKSKKQDEQCNLVNFGMQENEERDINKYTDAEGNNMQYFIKKLTNRVIVIYRKCIGGFIRYTYLHHIDESINLDSWKLDRISLCDAERNELILACGHENEGVLKISGEEDYLGGIHGDERYKAFTFFVDGKEMTVDGISDGMWCEEIRFFVKSDIFHCNGGTKVFEKTKQTIFDCTGIHINNRWKCLESVKLTHVRGCMLSVYKTVVTKFYDSEVNTYPVDIPESGNTFYNEKMYDTYYMGDISAHVWAGERGGDASMYAGIVRDFGDRMKSYFDCYTNYTTTVGEELHCQNNFNIIC